MGISTKVYDLNFASKKLFDGKVEDEYNFVLHWFPDYMGLMIWERESLIHSYEDVMEYFNNKYEDLNTDSTIDLLHFIKTEKRNQKLKELINEG